ncbi:PREDICTED: glutamate-rich protein 4 [Propithecus coquereli]|uniref:Glutamate rich 4 n=1 Tax=Propithecus coquereli TaxID=379532 RepID=A0A2K6GI93_PROCO|nr:PREDICTED: glutamate-rich protein 4 [Propithecus coquereli]
MELWRQLREAGLVPPGLGPPPRALRGVSPVDSPGQTLTSPGTDTGGARESLLWVWEELEKLRQAGVRLLGQLCSVGLQMKALQEDLVTILEEEEDSCEEEEEDEEPQRKQEEEHLGASCPAPSPPDFEMTI